MGSGWSVNGDEGAGDDLHALGDNEGERGHGGGELRGELEGAGVGQVVDDAELGFAGAEGEKRNLKWPGSPTGTAGVWMGMPWSVMAPVRTTVALSGR